MGERKGVNKYYPPDYDPRKGGLNKFLGTHALRERARKLHMGILIIRFEMPFNIWCEGCEKHIGMGVRYNAEKKKVGMYYSTPVYQFRMKCHLCDNHFEIKTDPANLDYIIVCGARRQERRWDPKENEQVAPEDKEATQKMAADAMFRLEHGISDKEKTKKVESTLKELEDFQDVRWKDDYAANKAMRDSMRIRRNEAKAQATVDAAYNLPMELLPPNDEDKKFAKLLQFTQTKSSEAFLKEKRALIDAESVFAKLKPKKLSAAAKKEKARLSIESIVRSKQKDFMTYRSTFSNISLGIVQKQSVSDTEQAFVNKEDKLVSHSPDGNSKVLLNLESDSVSKIPNAQWQKTSGSWLNKGGDCTDSGRDPLVSGKAGSLGLLGIASYESSTSESD